MSSHFDPAITNGSFSSSCPSTNVLNITDIIEYNPPRYQSLNEVGRLKGTTNTAKIDVSRRKKDATDIITTRFAKLKGEARTVNGVLYKII